MDGNIEKKESAPYKPPAIYNFPPFFTKQPNKRVHEIQLQSWSQLVAEYCEWYGIWVISKDGVVGDGKRERRHEIFRNETIGRGLKQEFIEEIMEYMVSVDAAHWYNKDQMNNYPKRSEMKKEMAVVLWKSLLWWAEQVARFVQRTGNENSVMTMFELLQGELSRSEPFYGMDEYLMYRVLQTLVSQNRAQLVKDEQGIVMGVKIAC